MSGRNSTQGSYRRSENLLDQANNTNKMYRQGSSSQELCGPDKETNNTQGNNPVIKILGKMVKKELFENLDRKEPVMCRPQGSVLARANNIS